MGLWGQTPSSMEESLKKQRESIEKQHAAVQKQIQAAGQAAQPSHSFFTAPWSPPPAPIVPPPAEITPPSSPASSSDSNPVLSEHIGNIVTEAAQREGLTPDLLRAVIEKESRGDPFAISSKGAMGLMQLMPGTAAELGVADPFDPEENVGAGARYLKQLLSRYDGALPLALAAYNAGPTRVDMAGGVPRIAETRDYVSSILGRLGAR